MGAIEKILIVFYTVATVRAHTHGIKLIVILALAYLLQNNNKKGNKKPKSLFRRSTDSMPITSDENLMLQPTHAILQRALDLDEFECAQLAVCRLGIREASGHWWHEKERVLLHSIFGNKGSNPRSKGEEAFQAAAELGRRAGGDEELCRQRYQKCPHSNFLIDSTLSGGG